MAIKCKVRILCPLVGVFPEYQPQAGKIYDADYRPAQGTGRKANAAVCVIDVLDKRIALRKGEYEIVGD